MNRDRDDDLGRSGAPVPDWLLERLARGELPPERAADVRRRLEAEGEAGVARLAALAASDRDILEALPPSSVTAEVHRRAALARRQEAGARPMARRTFVLPTLGLAALGALALFAVDRNRMAPPPAQPTEYIGVKGEAPQLSVHRKDGKKRQRLPKSAVVRPGEVLQLSYVAAGRRYGVVASVDARGTVTLHLPEAAGSSAALVARGETILPHAFELDDSPGPERFVFVSGDQSFPTDVVVASLRPGGPRLPSTLTLVDLTLHRSHKDKP